MDELTKKKQFLQLQFSLVLLVCSLLPDFDFFGAAISTFTGASTFKVAYIARAIGIVFGGWALYNFYQATKGKLPTPFLCGVGGGLVLALISLIPGVPSWFNYIALIVLFFGLWVSKASLGVEWRSIGSQGAYLILIACLLHCYSRVDSNFSTNIAALVGLVLSLKGLGMLAKSLDADGMAGASKLKTAIWLGIVGAIFGIIPFLGSIVAGIFAIIAFIIEFLGYTNLMKSEPLHQQGRDGAKTLRLSMIIMVIAAIIGIIPLLGSAIAGIIAIVALWFIYQGWTKILFGLEQ